VNASDQQLLRAFLRGKLFGEYSSEVLGELIYGSLIESLGYLSLKADFQ
jgi:hypothetical protein